MAGYINSSKIWHHQGRLCKSIEPISAEMIMTNFCNYDCPYCRYTHGDGYLSYEDFVWAASRLWNLGIRGLILTGGGEPILNPDMDRIVAWLEYTGMGYGINTNLTRPFKGGAKWLKVSMHDNGDQERVLANIKKTRADNPGMVLGIQGIVEKPGDGKKFYEKHKGVECDYIALRPLEVKHEAYTAEDLNEIRKELEALKRADDRIAINYKWDMMGIKFDECTANWTVITVDWNLDVWYCCHKPQEVVGNLRDEDILEKKKAYVSDMSVCDWPCRMTANNLAIQGYNDAKHVNFM